MSLDSRRARNLSTLSATRERGQDHCWHVVTADGVTLQRCVSEWQAQQRAAALHRGDTGSLAIDRIKRTCLMCGIQTKYEYETSP